MERWDRGRSVALASSAPGKSALGGPIDVVPLLQSLAKDGSVNLIQIGACDGDFEAGDASSNDPVQSFVAREPKVMAVLVEASPPTCAALASKVVKMNAGNRITTVNAAVASSSARAVPFYIVSDRFKQDYPRQAFHWAMCQLNSMDKEHVLKHHDFLGLSREQFLDYIEEIMVCCKTPAILLEEAHMMPKEVDVLAIDAEGLDEQILKSFLKFLGKVGAHLDTRKP